MKKLTWWSFLIVSLVLCPVLIVSANSGSNAKAITLKGWVSDSKCGAKRANAAHADCGNKCMQAGKKVVLVTDKDHQVITVDNPDTLKHHMSHHVAVTGMSHHVAVTGMVDEAVSSIHVDSVKMLATAEGGKREK